MKGSVVIFVLLLIEFLVENGETQIINSKQGKVVGTTEKTDFGNIRKFLGIPFAKPPVGKLRLKPPEPASNFKTTYQASLFRSNCIQLTTLPPQELGYLSSNQNEDCLYLNVYTPENVNTKVPVMVYIHGGAYTMGTGSTYIPNNMVARGKVIVVTINYRLGLLGFFPGGGKESTLGLRDQIMALKWVKDNIESYGGNPKEVTIFGQSAGSQSVSFLTLSPKSKGLFKRAISQSGVALSPWFPKFDDKLRRQKLLKKGRELGCKSSDPVECAREIPASKWTQFVAADGIPFYYPQVDNEVVMSDYATNYSKRLHPGLEVIMGLNMADGAMNIFYACSARYTRVCQPSSGVTTDELFRSVNLPKMDQSQKQVLVNTYTYWYPNKAPKGQMSLVAASELSTDFQYRVPVNESATYGVKKGNNVYVYQFNGKLNKNTLPWRNTWSNGADHGEELKFLFGKFAKTDSNYNLSMKMIEIWTDMAKGKMPKNWPKFTSNKAEYLLIDNQNPGGATRKPLLPKDKNNFWDNYKKTGVFSGAPGKSYGLHGIFTVLVIILTHI